MRSLVLGGSTFVGRRLVRRLVADGDEVTVLNRGRTASDLPAGVDRLVADRTDAESMRAALEGTEWDAVHDVSGFVMVAGGSPIGDLLALLDGRVGAYVFVSSIMAYAPRPVFPWTEDGPTSTEPVAKYGGFKAFAERTILERHAATGFPGSVARPAAIYGPDNNIHDMETAMFLRLRRGLPVLLPHGGLVAGNYGHVDDLCALLAAMAREPRAAGEVVNATGDAITSAGYVRMLADVVGAEADVRLLPDELIGSEGAPLFGHLFHARHHAVLSTEKARRDLGLPEARDLGTGHRETYEWFCSTGLVDAPDTLSDPVWGAGYDFAAEARVAARL
ncbi:Rossmann-fold NAD(P)-binding domain-containing protein [Jatrophihabitans fulvus]